MEQSWAVNHWTNETYESFIQFLEQQEDKKNQAFLKKLVPNVDNIIGMRTPLLRKIAAQIYAGNPMEFMEICKEQYYEELMLEAMILGKMKPGKDMTLEQLLTYLKEFIPKLNSWSVCDTLCADLKMVKKNKETMLEFCLPYLKSEREFEVRFPIVLLLAYYCEKEYLPLIFNLCDEVNCEPYYVMMGVAWLLSKCYVKEEAMTLAYLERCQLDQVTYKKTLQKIIESRQITEEQRKFIKELRSKPVE